MVLALEAGRMQEGKGCDSFCSFRETTKTRCGGGIRTWMPQEGKRLRCHFVKLSK